MISPVYGPHLGDAYHPFPVFKPASTRKLYSIHSMFRTIQGEGYHAGRLAVFIRVNSCNVWSGREEDRDRDAKKGSCARFCDTQFFGIDEKNGGGRLTADEIVKRAKDLWPFTEPMFVVFTGGEPSLQVDPDLISRFREGFAKDPYLAMETNGSKDLGSLWLNWVTLSPKPPMYVNPNNAYDEVKVLYPEYNPLDFCFLTTRKYIQAVEPVDSVFHKDVWKANMQKCVEFVHAHPDWRVSVQQHKVLGIP